MKLLAVVLTVLAGPSAADVAVAFQSPTGNIHCMIHEFGGSTQASCVMRDYRPSYKAIPAGCSGLNIEFTVLDWSKAGGLGCSDDMLVRSANPVLPYGDAVSLGGISCVSAKTGMTCTNADGHGFTVAKARQRFF